MADRCGDNLCGATETIDSCPQDCSATFVLQNASTFTINHFFFFPCGSNPGPDFLNGGTLPPQTMFTLSKIPAGCFDFEITNTAGGSLRSPDLTLEEGHTFTETIKNAN